MQVFPQNEVPVIVTIASVTKLRFMVYLGVSYDYFEVILW